MGAHSSMGGGGALSLGCAKDGGGRSFEHGRLDGPLRYISGIFFALRPGRIHFHLDALLLARLRPLGRIILS